MKKTYYKYRSLQSPFTKSIFEKAEIFYAAPKDFNDPFDCNLRVHTNGSTDQDWEEYFDKLIALDPSATAALQQAKREKWWNTQPGFKDSLGKAQHQKHYEQSSVFCFAKKGNSIPMFSYYADGHCGVAVEFQFDDLHVPCGVPSIDPTQPTILYDNKIVFRDVEYPSSYPELNYHKVYGTDQLLRSLLFTKHHEWSHEEEFRIFRRNVPASSVQFDKSLLTRIVFGCKAKQDQVDLVRGWIVDWPTDVVLSKAEIVPHQFDLVIKDFETIKGTGKP